MKVIIHKITFSTSNILFGQKTVNFCATHPSQLTSNLSYVFFNASNANKTQLVTLTNPTNAPIQIGQLFIDGGDASRFALQSKTTIMIRPGSNAKQPKEDCSNTVLAPYSSCSFRVAFFPPASYYSLGATIHIPTAGRCELLIPIKVCSVGDCY